MNSPVLLAFPDPLRTYSHASPHSPQEKKKSTKALQNANLKIFIGLELGKDWFRHVWIALFCIRKLWDRFGYGWLGLDCVRYILIGLDRV